MINDLHINWAIEVPPSRLFGTKPIDFENWIIIRQGNIILCFGKNNGNQIWTFEIKEEVSCGEFLLQYAGILITDFSHGKRNSLDGIVAIDILTGKELWKTAFNTVLIDSHICFFQDKIYVLDHSREKNQSIHVINMQNGTIEHVYQLPFSSMTGMFSINKDYMIGYHHFPNSTNPGVFKFNLETGDKEIIIQEPIALLSQNSYSFFVSIKTETQVQKLLGFNKLGKKSWEKENLSGLNYFAVDTKNLYLFNPNDKSNIQIYHINNKELLHEFKFSSDEDVIFYPSNGFVIIKDYYNIDNALFETDEKIFLGSKIKTSCSYSRPFYESKTRILYIAIKDRTTKKTMFYSYNL